MLDIIDYAQKYWDIGLMIIPLNGKKALTSWEEYQEKRPMTENYVKKNFFNSNCNIAIVTGKVSNIIVLDIDNQESYEVMKSILPLNTPICKTTHGYHYYFSYEQGYNNMTRTLTNGLRKYFNNQNLKVDLRSDGGYVVAPPSIHPDSKQEYEWINDIVEYVPQSMPTWLKDVILASKNIVTPDFIQDAPKDWIDSLLETGVQEGSRNDTAARISGYFFNKGLSKTTVLHILTDWNKKNEPPLNDKELKTIIESIYKKHLEHDTVLDDKVKFSMIKGILNEKGIDNETLFKIHNIYSNISYDNKKEDENPENALAIINNALGIEILKIQKVNKEEPVYIFELKYVTETRKIEILPKDLIAFKVFQSKISSSLNRFIKKPKTWNSLLETIFSIADEVTPDMIETELGAFEERVLIFLSEAKEVPNENVKDRPCFIFQKNYYLSLVALKNYFKLNNVETGTDSKIAENLRLLGWKRKSIALYDDAKKKNIGSRSMYYKECQEVKYE